MRDAPHPQAAIAAKTAKQLGTRLLSKAVIQAAIAAKTAKQLGTRLLSKAVIREP